jgi:hypothetical protein
MRHRPLNADEQSELSDFAIDGLALLGADRDASDLLQRIDAFVSDKQKTSSRAADPALSADEMIELSWSIGSVLGGEFVERLGWTWSLIGDDDAARFGITSPDAALALYPSFFVRDCIEDPARDFTALLIFNMVVAGRFNDVPDGTCLDLADNVVRIVPR